MKELLDNVIPPTGFELTCSMCGTSTAKLPPVTDQGQANGMFIPVLIIAGDKQETGVICTRCLGRQIKKESK